MNEIPETPPCYLMTQAMFTLVTFTPSCCFKNLFLQAIKMIKPVHPKGNQPWIFIGRTDAEAEAPILWPPDVKNWFIGKDPDAGKDWRWEEKGMTEDEMVR